MRHPNQIHFGSSTICYFSAIDSQTTADL